MSRPLGKQALVVGAGIGGLAAARVLAERVTMADLALPGTRGERPPDFEQRLQMGLAMGKLAAQDPAVHKLMAEVTSLLKPRSVYQDPALMERVREVMAAG